MDSGAVHTCRFVHQPGPIDSVSSFLIALRSLSAGPPCLLPPGDIGPRGPQRPPGGPHGSGCAVDGDVSPDVQTDGDWAEPGDRTLQPAGQRWERCGCQGDAHTGMLASFVTMLLLISFFISFGLYTIFKHLFGWANMMFMSDLGVSLSTIALMYWDLSKC